MEIYKTDSEVKYLTADQKKQLIEEPLDAVRPIIDKHIAWRKNSLDLNLKF